jgi:hypothetical protein
MKHTVGLTLTNYVEKSTGIIYHGSELTYSERFKSGRFEKIKSYQACQSFPYADSITEIEGKKYWKMVRNVYGKKVFECDVECTKNC